MALTLYDALKFFDYTATRPEPDAGRVVLTDLVSDARKVTPGAAFYAHQGAHVDGRSFIPEAIARGARLILLQANEADAATRRACGDLPIIALRAPSDLGKFAAYFFGYPSRRLRLLGVTGTNGKTTITFLIAQLLQGLEKKCYILGTLGCGFLGKLHKSPNTTLEPIELQRTLAQAVEEGARYAVMEVSSIGAAENRISGCEFFGGIFTNLTRDHLDYHHTMENYAAAKLKFLRMVPPEHVVLNAMDEYGRKWLDELAGSIYYAAAGALPFLADKRGLLASRLEFTHEGTQFAIDSALGDFKVKLPLYGAFNVFNYLAAISLLHVLGQPFPELMRVSAQLQPVVGRMERFAVAGCAPVCIVDYAHTPDGVEQALKAAREHMDADGVLACVLGCGGDRDSGKRPVMAQKAAVYADRVFITADNPRTEDPLRIIDDMLLGVVAARDKIEVIPDRKAAIAAAFKWAQQENGVLLVAGKGHEDYQILKDKTIHFSDREEVCRLLGLPAPQPLYAAAQTEEQPS